MTHLIVIFILAFAAGAALTRWTTWPLGWWLFKLAHRDNPEALAFADREMKRQ